MKRKLLSNLHTQALLQSDSYLYGLQAQHVAQVYKLQAQHKVQIHILQAQQKAMIKQNRLERKMIHTSKNDRIASDMKTVQNETKHRSFGTLHVYNTKRGFQLFVPAPRIAACIQMPFIHTCMYVAGTARMIIILLQWCHKTSTGSSILLL